MRITENELQLITGLPGASFSDELIMSLRSTFIKYGITSPLNVCHFIAQTCHESMCYQKFEELADGSAYEGRTDLGNVEPGDGRAFKGRGAIQITGRTNYRDYGRYIGAPTEAEPELLARLPWAVDSAGWYWQSRGLTELALRDDIHTITRRINGGLNGLQQRIAYYHRAKNVLMPSAPDMTRNRLSANELPVSPPPLVVPSSSDNVPSSSDNVPDKEKATPEKPWWLSKTLIGIILAGASVFVRDFGLTDAWRLAADLSTMAGLGWAAYGRIVAKHTLTTR